MKQRKGSLNKGKHVSIKTNGKPKRMLSVLDKEGKIKPDIMKIVDQAIKPFPIPAMPKIQDSDVPMVKLDDNRSEVSNMTDGLVNMLPSVGKQIYRAVGTYDKEASDIMKGVIDKWGGKAKDVLKYKSSAKNLDRLAKYGSYLNDLARDKIEEVDEKGQSLKSAVKVFKKLQKPNKSQKPAQSKPSMGGFGSMTGTPLDAITFAANNQDLIEKSLLQGAKNVSAGIKAGKSIIKDIVGLGEDIYEAGKDIVEEVGGWFD